MFFKLPSFFELILPLSLYIGILLSFGRLYADSEMVVLRACGMSPGRLATLLMPVTLVISLVVSRHVTPAGTGRLSAGSTIA